MENTAVVSDQPEIVIDNTQISKKQKALKEKKFRKKVAQAQSVLVKAEERTFDNIIQIKEPSIYLIFTHFGNGDEIDQNVLFDFCTQKGGELQNLTIFPGINYGHLEFKNIESATKLMEAMDSPNCANITFPDSQNPDRTVVFFYTPLKLSELKKSENIEISMAPMAKTGLIPGLYVWDDFITEEEEKAMLKSIDAGKWTKLLNRRVQHFGYEFKYGTNNVDTNQKVGELPSFCDPLLTNITKILKTFKVEESQKEAIKLFEGTNLADLNDELLNEQNPAQNRYFEHSNGMFDQLTLNDYLPGQGIPPHVDTHSPFEEVFASLGLKSGVTMHFKTPENLTKDLYLKPRSLIIFSGEVRYNWLHSIATRKIDKIESDLNPDGMLKFRSRRVSLTLRKVNASGKACECRWSQMCDSQNKSVAVTENLLGGEAGQAPVYQENDKKPIKATNMEKEHVYDVYEKIAPHFSNTRYKGWPKVEEFLNAIPAGSIVADVGCGNGKYLGCNAQNLFNIGTDRSFGLIDCCKQKDISYQTFVADSLTLPLRSSCFDRIISIAVVHHFSTDSLRIQAISEFHRILRVGGQCLIYVWAYEQEHKKFQQQDVFVKWNLQDTYQKGQGKKKQNDKGANQIPEEETKTQTSFIETAIKDEEKKTTVYHRYYHMFLKGELEKLINENFEGKLKIIDGFFDHANWVVVCEKTQ